MMSIGLIAMAAYWFMPQENETTTQNDIEKKERIILPQYAKSKYQNIPEVKSYLQDVSNMIKEGKSVLPLTRNELDITAQEAQNIILNNSDFLKDTKMGETLLHNDMMRITPALVGELDESLQKVCQNNLCYLAEKYNFVTNTTTKAIINITDKQVLKVTRYPNMQTDISLRLTHIAQAIALNAPEIKKELGKAPQKRDMSMANVRGALQASPCENSTHLCVAPTFANHYKEEALWAIIDLTELKLVAAKWAGLGKTTTPACISERSLQNRYIMENFCQKNTVLEKDNWKITYRLTGSDGLEIRDVFFKGKPVLTSAKIVDWHVSYQQKGSETLDTTTETYIEGRRVEFVRGNANNYLFGYNDAMGCPMFSTSVVLPFNAPQVKTLIHNDGFMLTQDFRNPKWPMACNYRYENRFEFYNDGSFRVVGVNKGRGCGDHAIYRPVMRIDMALGNNEKFYSYEKKSWKVWKNETSTYVETKEINQYPYKITSKQGRAYYIEPNHGQFEDNSRGDHATLFVSRFKENEGDTDLLTLGSCCDLNDDGVAQYINDENIFNENVVLWYVPRIQNDTKKGQEYCWADTGIGEDGNLEVKVWPCTVGPKIIPINEKK